MRMTARRWIALTLTTIAAAIGLATLAAFMIDPFGVLRDPTGRKLSVYDFERNAKFFMNQRYVPANFDGLIIGASSAANWDMPVLGGTRMYNDCLPGGNIVEESILVDQALRKGRFKLAVILLSPIETRTHEIHDGLDTIRSSEAIASIPLLYNEAAGLLRASGLPFRKSDASPDGKVELPYRKNLYAEPLPPDVFQIDPPALLREQQLVGTLENRGTRVIYVVPPVYEPLYQVNRSSYEAWLKTILPLIPRAPVINLNTPEYSVFRGDSSNFIDPFHLEPQAATEEVELLGRLVSQAAASAN